MGETLRNKFELEKRRLSYTDHMHYEDVKNRLNMAAASPSNSSQKQPKEIERDEIVRHMSNLPSFLDPAKATPDRALSFGVMDWGRLEKWQYQQHHHKSSPSSSINSSPFFSTDGSTPQSTSGQTCFTARQKPHRVTLQSHFNRSSCLGNGDKFHDSNNNKKTEPKYCKLHDSDAPNVTESESSIVKGKSQIKASSLKGKMKMQDGVVNETVKVLPACFHGYDETNTRNPSSTTSGSNTLQEKRSSFCSITSDKPRNMSPNRRFSFGMVSKSPASVSTMRSVESPVSQKSTMDTHVSVRAQSSPLRRLLEPLFPLKSTNSRKSSEKPRADSKIKSKVDLRSSSDDSLRRNETTRALFQTAVKNGRPLFTFAVENDNNVLAATVRDLTSSAKDDSNNCWIYTFFTVDEIKKKTGGWLSHSRRDNKAHSYVPNMTAQMSVSNRSVSKCDDTREFSLYRVDPTRVDELAGIVVKFSRNAEDENQERFSTTVVLPGGNHGVSSNGKPSPLIERWRSNGVCDCGGWDLGCRLRTLTNQAQCSSRSSDLRTGQFELFFQGDMTNERRFFSLCPLKEKIFSIEYNSSLSPLQAFSICISVLECRESSQHTSSRTYEEDKQVVQDDPNPVRFASFPPLSPVGRV